MRRVPPRTWRQALVGLLGRPCSRGSPARPAHRLTTELRGDVTVSGRSLDSAEFVTSPHGRRPGVLCTTPPYLRCMAPVSAHPGALALHHASMHLIVLPDTGLHPWRSLHHASRPSAPRLHAPDRRSLAPVSNPRPPAPRLHASDRCSLAPVSTPGPPAPPPRGAAPALSAPRALRRSRRTAGHMGRGPERRRAIGSPPPARDESMLTSRSRAAG
jgi:hypothetical protein